MIQRHVQDAWAKFMLLKGFCPKTSAFTRNVLLVNLAIASWLSTLHMNSKGKCFARNVTLIGPLMAGINLWTEILFKRLTVLPTTFCLNEVIFKRSNDSKI